MMRHDRLHFMLLGALPLLNILGMLLYGLGLATHGTGGAAASLPYLVGLAGLCLLTVIAAAVKRGRDVGLAAWQTILACLLCTSLGPVLLLVVGYLAFAKASPKADVFGPPAGRPGVGTWLWAVVNLLWPWAVLAVLARVL